MKSLICLALLGPGLFVPGWVWASPSDQVWQEKVDAWVLRTGDEWRRTEFLVVLDAQADVSGSVRVPDKAARGAWVSHRLRQVAQRTQGPVLRVIRDAGARYRPYWVTNMIWVEGDLRLAEALARRKDVRRLIANPRVALPLPTKKPSATGQVRAIEPNLQQTQAPAVFWNAAVTGEGIVVANQDTGVQWSHPALVRQYRGFDGQSVDHNYHWHDAIHSGGGVCGADSPVPCDDNDHGTLTMGVMVGDDDQGNQIGMAPDARWISCRNMDEGVGTPATYAECFQFFIAPTDLDDQNPRPELAPHVVNNSWICPPSEGCEDPDALRTVVENTRAAGIAVVASGGNTGPGCASVESPPATYDASFSVGAVNIFGEITQFSSRGPVSIDGSYRLKPDLVAPGDDVRTSVRGGGYASFSGTSLAGPHVAGMTALVMQAQGCFTGNVDALESWLTANARPFTTSEGCGQIPGMQVPNNTYGAGILKAAMPAPEDCRAPVAGALTGLATGVARCTNRTSGESVSTPVRGTVWDCGGAGLVASPGDSLLVTLRGAKVIGPLTGTTIGVQPAGVLCRNQTSGQTVPLAVTPGQQTWDCTAAGLVAGQGDDIRQTFVGSAP